ncbi:MAG: choice-of-anchor D domain-containing protein [Myxococcales bacterium]|nr:choice-of-anchor D domain-containing protein [Myxococcales bacterium]
MKTTHLRLFLALGVAAASVLGCKCGPTQTTDGVPDYRPSPAALSFEACPTKDETGGTVMDVFPDKQKVTIENVAKASGGLALSITGTDATAFSVVGTPPATVGSLSSVEVEVQFSPAKKGELRADLVIDDQTEGTDNQIVTLVGTGTNLPAQPSIGTSPQKTDKTGYLNCEEASPLSDCTLQFPDTLYDHTEVLEVKIRNKGCPALKITGLAIESARGDQQNFSIDSPAVLPSATSPILLSTADGTEETTVRIRFSPVDDGTGNVDRFASLVILSNDPLLGDGFAQPARIALSATAVKPSIYTSPTFCDFSNPSDLCGEAAKVPDSATFQVTNDGNASVRIKSVKFRSSGGSTGAGGRFTISQDITGQDIAPLGTATLKIAHNDMPLYVSDVIDIEAVLPGPPEVNAGTIAVAVYGGLKPCLTTDPMDQMNFNNPANELTAQTLLIKNGAGCGTLIINEVSIEANPFFTLLDPQVPPNTQVPAGGQVEATVQYRRPPSGGMQIGTLRVRSNDTDFGPPQYKIVQLLSQSPLDRVPIATLSGCLPPSLINDPTCTMGPTTSLTVNLSTTNPKEVTLSGVKSTDDNQVREYRFKLLPPLPAGATSANLANHDTKIMTPTTKLTIPDGATGLYRVSLEVWDDRGQKSGNTPVLLVNVYP